MKAGASDAMKLLDRYKNDLEGHIDVAAAHQATRASGETAERLLRLAGIGQFDPVTFILRVDEDILGCFRYSAEEGVPAGQVALSPSESQKWYWPQYSTEIRLYWGVIGLVSKILNVTVEGLAVVVLAHELGHAYTHLGFDRDGLRWTGAGFYQSAHTLKEGLAQFYPLRVCKRLSQRIPDALEAYEALLPKQPAAYHTHVPWVEGEVSTESLAATLAHVRRCGAVSLQLFEEELKRTSRRLKLQE